jgi:7-cyano-7-deazaguanine tRNA-ribosyltransferase
MLEIKIHDGPARLGNYGEVKTPAILNQDSLLTFIEDEPMPYNVPKPLAEFSVQQTIQKAKESNDSGLAVIHGSKYLELRIHCAQELEKLGNQVLMIANPEELMKRPRDLVNMVVNIREAVNPNSALYFSFVKTSFIPLLCYMGVDLFGDVACDFYAQLDRMMTPNTIYNLKEYNLYEFSLKELKDYNRNSMDFVLREVRENIKNGTLRNLVEERCCSHPEAMSALRIFDRDYNEFLDKYTPLF